MMKTMLKMPFYFTRLYYFLRVISRYTDENNLVLSFEKLFNWRRAEWGYEN
ncbi:hypothetical protein RV13_GL001580 [Enterococcus raffinosus]|nr:hypothetical protein RV13_GL001580 [Enterococcus raffinosus]